MKRSDFSREVLLLCSMAMCIFVACGQKGEFTAAISGGVEIALEGESLFEVVHGAANHRLFVLELRNGKQSIDNVSIIRFMNSCGSLPREGANQLIDYRLTPEQASALWASEQPSTLGATFEDSHLGRFNSIGGKLVITTQTSDEVSGSFDFPGLRRRELRNGQREETFVRMTGHFRAIKGRASIQLD